MLTALLAIVAKTTHWWTLNPFFLEIFSSENFTLQEGPSEIFYFWKAFIKPSLIEDPEEHSQLPSIDDLLPEYLNELQEDTVMDRKVRTTCRGDVEYLRIRLEGSKPSSAKWIEIGQVRQLYPHLSNVWKQTFGGRKSFFSGEVWSKWILACPLSLQKLLKSCQRSKQSHEKSP